MSNVFVPAIAAPAQERAAYLRKVAVWTFAGLTVTGLTSMLSMMFVVPVVFRGGTWVVLGVVYGSFLLAQTVARKMVFGGAKGAGFLLGTTAQGIALGFLLAVTLAMGRVGDGLRTIGYAMAMTIASSLAMLVYVNMEKRDFSMLRAGLSIAFVPMLILMGLQLVFPIGGTFGIVIAAVFLLVSVAAMLWTLNKTLHEMPTTMAMEGGYEISLSIVVLFWNLLSLLNRFRR